MADDKITNDGFANEVADITFNRIATTFSDFMENIKTGQNGIAMDILKIKETLANNEKKISADETILNEHEERLNKKREEIKQIREDFEQYKEDLRIIAEIKPTLTTLQNFINWWTWWKVAVLVIFVIIFFIGLQIFSHSTGIVELWNDRQGGLEDWGKNLREHQAVDKGTTRAIKTYKMTDKQIDSIQKEIMRSNNIKGI